LREGVHQEGAEGRLALAAAERPGGGDAVERLAEHAGKELGLEALRRLLDLGLGGLRAGGRRDRRRGQDVERDGLGGEGAHHITWMSACRAPAVLIACRMEIMSRGVTPRALRPATSEASD